MMVDPLHHLLKGMVEYTMKWCVMHVKDQQPSCKRKHDNLDKVNPENMTGTGQVDERLEHRIWYLFLSTESKLDVLLSPGRALPSAFGPNRSS